MRHPETHAITARHGPRPAGPPDRCFYCDGPVGAQHARDCVMRQRTVVVRMTVEYVVEVPENLPPDMIEFMRNEGSWCATNALDELQPNEEEDPEGNCCLCHTTAFEYVREATPEDEKSIWFDKRLFV